MLSETNNLIEQDCVIETNGPEELKDLPDSTITNRGNYKKSEVYMNTTKGKLNAITIYQTISERIYIQIIKYRDNKIFRQYYHTYHVSVSTIGVEDTNPYAYITSN